MARRPDIESYAAAALDSVSEGPWGERRLVAPVPVTFGAPAAVPPG